MKEQLRRRELSRTSAGKRLRLRIISVSVRRNTNREHRSHLPEHAGVRTRRNRGKVPGRRVSRCQCTAECTPSRLAPRCPLTRRSVATERRILTCNNNTSLMKVNGSLTHRVVGQIAEAILEQKAPASYTTSGEVDGHQWHTMHADCRTAGMVACT